MDHHVDFMSSKKLGQEIGRQLVGDVRQNFVDPFERLHHRLALGVVHHGRTLRVVGVFFSGWER